MNVIQFNMTNFFKQSANEITKNNLCRKQDRRDNLKVERRDASKGIKKGGGGGNPRKISLEQLRREKNKRGGGEQGGRKDGGKPKFGKKGGKRFNKRHGGKPMPKDPAAREKMLDQEIENYWIKGGHNELGK